MGVVSRCAIPFTDEEAEARRGGVPSCAVAPPAGSAQRPPPSTPSARDASGEAPGAALRDPWDSLASRLLSSQHGICINDISQCE